MPKHKTFTLYWRTGKRETVIGADIADAMTRAGYGGGAARALDFWAHGDNHEYHWDAAARNWVKMKAAAQEGTAP
jgi:hypothetical protein